MLCNGVGHIASTKDGRIIPCPVCNATENGNVRNGTGITSTSSLKEDLGKMGYSTNMKKQRILGTINPYLLKKWIKQAFQVDGINSVGFLKDDRRVAKADEKLYQKIPLFPFHAAIKVLVGKKGF